MSLDRVVTRVRDVIRDRLTEDDSITMTRRAVTDLYREAHHYCLAQEWATGNYPCVDEGDIDVDGAMQQIIRNGKRRMSKGQAMKVRLSLEGFGVESEPSLERLNSDTDSVRFFRKWQPLE
ncbi:hypothetical protein [Streptomyces sp. NBC_01455]|uniref:hypothetical protein n=1 Tax=Streptomyces sp. NBC_01455 TaxID=2903874 RepID=UPI002E376D23|nr:hypothetical protein [Streptomyces sp. NBC_01455]